MKQSLAVGRHWLSLPKDMQLLLQDCEGAQLRRVACKYAEIALSHRDEGRRAFQPLVDLVQTWKKSPAKNPGVDKLLKRAEKEVAAAQQDLAVAQRELQLGERTFNDYLAVHVYWCSGVVSIACTTADPREAAAGAYSGLRMLLAKVNQQLATEAISRLAEQCLDAKANSRLTLADPKLKVVLCSLPTAVATLVIQSPTKQLGEFTLKSAELACASGARPSTAQKRLLKLVDLAMRKKSRSTDFTSAKIQVEEAVAQALQQVDHTLLEFNNSRVCHADYRAAELNYRRILAIASCLEDSPNVGAAKAAEQSRLAIQLSNEEKAIRLLEGIATESCAAAGEDDPA